MESMQTKDASLLPLGSKKLPCPRHHIGGINSEHICWKTNFGREPRISEIIITELSWRPHFKWESLLILLKILIRQILLIGEQD